MKYVLKNLLFQLSEMILPFLFRALQRPPALLARASAYCQWKFAAKANPQYFKHEFNLYRWRFTPRLWAFTARGVFARERMFPGCKVLDLCCGDGSIPYLFFTDIAGSIDAIDRDAAAIAYARRNFIAPNLHYHEKNILNEPLPDSDYDFVVWNAGISYFSEIDIVAVLKKVLQTNRKKFELIGLTPRAYNYVDHKHEFQSGAELKKFLATFFSHVETKEIDEGNITNIYFRAWNA